MRVAQGLEILELSTLSTGRDGSIHLTFLWDDKSAVLVDAGLPEQMPMMKEKIEAAGVPFGKLTKIIISHHDLDHIGSLQSIQNELGENLTTIAHVEEKPYIEFQKNPMKMSPEQIEKARSTLQSKVDTVASHQEEYDDCGGIICIHTPGHSPGHLSLYLKKYKILIAGDALNVVDGELMGPHPRFSPDFEQAKRSLKRLLDYDIQSVICYHGGLYSENVMEKIMQISEI